MSWRISMFIKIFNSVQRDQQDCNEIVKFCLPEHDNTKGIDLTETLN